MPKNYVSYKSIQRQVNNFVSSQRGDPNRFRILAEGDSWFSTPVEGWKGPTLIAALRRHRLNGKRQFNVVSVANPSADLRDMLDADNLDLKFAANPAWLGSQTYDLILLSCGGNDFLGTELKFLILDANGQSRCLARSRSPEEAARCLLDCPAFCDLMSRLRNRLTDFRKQVLKPLGISKPPILVHGYDYALPSGRFTKVAKIIKVGPWLKPEFTSKHIDTKYHTALVKLMIDEFNTMLRAVATSQRNFFYLDLRGTLSSGDWADEIHAHTSTGIPRIRSRFVTAIHSIRDGTAPPVISDGSIEPEYSCPCR